MFEEVRIRERKSAKHGKTYNADFNNEGYPIGLPTVKELVAILRQLPQDYKVTCCGANNYLYLFEEDNEKYITIDNEWYLG